jgi:mannose-6-phosphate isomerase
MYVSKRLFRVTALPQANIWGTQRLAGLVEVEQTMISGEAFLVSAMSHGDSPIDGMTFSQFYQQYKHEYFGLSLESFPLRINLIDTSAALSIQVHPGPDLTAKEGYPSGVREFWLVLEAQEAARLAIGHHAPSKAVLSQALEQGTIEQWLDYHEVKVGDYFDLRYGTVHAIGQGMLIYELTYNLDYTYRLYDYQRIDQVTGQPRVLHVQAALAAIAEPQDYQLGHDQGLAQQVLVDDDGFAKLMVWRITEALVLATNEFYLLTIVAGIGMINDQSVKAYQTYFVPKNTELTISGGLTILAVTYREQGAEHEIH